MCQGTVVCHLKRLLGNAACVNTIVREMADQVDPTNYDAVVAVDSLEAGVLLAGSIALRHSKGGVCLPHPPVFASRACVSHNSQDLLMVPCESRDDALYRESREAGPGVTPCEKSLHFHGVEGVDVSRRRKRCVGGSSPPPPHFVRVCMREYARVVPAVRGRG